MPPTKRTSGNNLPVDAAVAYKNSLAFQFDVTKIFGTKMGRFLKANAAKFGVNTAMVTPGLLAAVSNAMGMSELQFTPDWHVSTNGFFILVANKGTGKTPSSKLFMKALLDLEEEDVKAAARAKGRKKKRKSDEKKGGDPKAKRKSFCDNFGEDDSGDREDDQEIIEGENGEQVSDKASDRDQRANRRKFHESFNSSDINANRASEALEDDNDYQDEKDEEVEEEEIETDTQTDADECFKFSKQQRTIDVVTPEALILALHHGSGVLLIKSDEFKGFWDRCIEAAHNVSALCSAYSGEEISYTTVKRGSIKITSNRLSLFGCIQPGPLTSIINGSSGSSGVTKPDDQGVCDRFLLFPGAEDPSVKFRDQLKAIDPEVQIDVKKFLKMIITNHSEPSSYTVSIAAMEVFIKIKEELREIDIQSGSGNEVAGMTSKAFTNLQKVATLMTCIRETLQYMDAYPDGGLRYSVPDDFYTVTVLDVENAWEIIKLSMHTYKSFKPVILRELGDDGDETLEDDSNKLLEEEEINPDMILEGAKKVRQIYLKAKDGKILPSVIKNYQLYPSKMKINGELRTIDAEIFTKALIKFGVARVEEKMSNNRLKCSILKLTFNTEDKQCLALFQHLHRRLSEQGISFDPLDCFEQKKIGKN